MLTVQRSIDMCSIVVTYDDGEIAGGYTVPDLSSHDGWWWHWYYQRLSGFMEQLREFRNATCTLEVTDG